MKRTAIISLSCLLLCTGLLASEEFEGFVDEDEEALEEVTVESAIRLQVSQSTDLEFELSVERPNDKEADTSYTSTGSWDADEFEGFEKSQREELTLLSDVNAGLRRKQSIWKKQESYTREMIGIALLTIYLLNVLWGKIQNESLALAWARTFVAEGSIMEKNFALLGAGDAQDGDVLTKESHASFKFYASGRRYTQALLATLDLKARQDLLALALFALLSKTDTIDLTAFLNDEDMGPMVCVLASPKMLKALLRENEDIKTYTREIPVKQIPKWPLDKVNVWTESPDMFYDLMVPEVKNVFLSSEFESVYGKYFRYIHITSDYGNGSHKKVIRFSFNLPTSSKMHELTRLMSLIPLIIDLVAEYVPSQEAKKRAERHRTLESERIWREGAEERKEAFQQKKAEEQQAEMERIRRLPPAEQQKAMEKQQRLKQRRSMKVKTLRA